jgi:hypothetical protein
LYMLLYSFSTAFVSDVGSMRMLFDAQNSPATAGGHGLFV